MTADPPTSRRVPDAPISSRLAGALALGAALLLSVAACSGGEGQAQEADGAVVPSDPDVVGSRADRARALGDTAAPLTVHEISDFECPYCQRFYQQTWPTLEEEYVEEGHLQYVWHVFPNPNHARAWPAGEAAFCAGAVGKFWPMHDRLFEEQAAWTGAGQPADLFVEWAEEMGIDGESYRSCLVHDLAAPFMIRDYGAIARANIQGTPFFSIQGRDGSSLSMQGVQPADRFRAVLDSLLREQGVQPPGS